MIELEQLGWNVLTVAFVSLMIIRVFGIAGAIRQGSRIWRRKNAESVSPFAAGYFALHMIAESALGVTIGSIVLIAAIPRFMAQALVVGGIWKYRGYKWPAIVLTVAVVVGQVLAIVYSFEGPFFMAVGLGTLIAVAAQPLDIWRHRSSGNADIFYLSVFLVGSIFWTVYAVATNNIWLMVVAPPQVVLNLLTVILWFVFRKK